MARYAMAIDLEACVGCAACAVACVTENQVPPGVTRLWIREIEEEGPSRPQVEFRPEQCYHCENPPCVPVCPTGATYQRQDGLVLLNPTKCIACGACVVACPYDSRFLHPDGHVDKCTFCAHRLEAGRDPACVETCPTGARVFGDLEDEEGRLRAALASARRVDVRKPHLGTEPRLFYLNAPRATGLGGEE